MAPKILVAEDEEADVLLLKRAIEKAHVEAPVEFVRDGREAMRVLEDVADQPVLLLLDLHMPRMNGFELLEWLKTQRPAKPVSVIVLSCSGEPEDIKQAGSLGVRAYIVKPEDPKELVRIVQRIQQLWDPEASRSFDYAEAI